MIIIFILAGLFLVCIGFLWMIKPGKNPDAREIAGREFAHRGLHDQMIPENSLAAFRAARQNGIPVELDVQYTKDLQVVVFHDATLERMCGEDRRVGEMTYQELNQFRLLNTDEKIPLFSQVLKELDGTDIICEIKYYDNQRLQDLCRDTYELFKEYKGKVYVESFSPFAIAWFRKYQPQVIRGQLAKYGKLGEENIHSIAMFALRTLLVNVVGRPDFIAYDFHKTGFCCRLCRLLFRPIFVAWTARGDRERKQAKDGFDAVIFEKLEGKKK